MSKKITHTNSTKNNIVLYTHTSGEVELRADIEKDTLWATQEQIAHVFDTTKQNIGLHMKNIFAVHELTKKAVVKDSFTTASDGKKYKVKFYNLDAIIAVGYRVNSKKATQFRIWATQILREYLVKGYALNKYSLENSDQKFDDLHEAIAFMESKKDNEIVKGTMSIRLTKKLIR